MQLEGYTDDDLNDVYDKTDGHCHICGKKLSFKNYGKKNEKAPWEVDHKKPKAKGGSDNFRNLWPACCLCNQEKGDTYPYPSLYDYVDGVVKKIK